MNKNYFTSIIPIKTLKTFCFLLVISFSISVSSYGQITKTLTVSDTSPLEIPAGVTSLFVQTWGAGGGGGASNSLLSAGGGGGGGAFSQGTVIVGVDENNVKVPYTVGLGGAGGTTANINGSNGGSTIFSTISANPGQGGAGGLGINPVLYYGAGGLGGAASVGNYSGGKGANAYLLGASVIPLVIQANISGGGGGSGGATPNGTLPSNGTSVTGQNGAVVVSSGNPALIYRGAGGDGRSLGLLDAVLSAEKPGNPGGNPGGGGGGAAGVGILNGVVDLVLGVPRASTGGKGGDGQIKVTYTCPVYSITCLAPDVSFAESSKIVLKSTPLGLPKGKYKVAYSITVQGVSTPKAPVEMKVGIPGEGEIEVLDLPTVGSYIITVTNLTSVDCSNLVNSSITINRAAGTITNPTCAEPKGSVTLSGLVIGGTIYQTGVSTKSYEITKNPQTILDLDSGNYNFVISSGNCSSQTVSVIVPVSINPLPIKTWDGSNWTPGTPTIEDKAIFTSNYDKNESVTACSCEVKLGADVVFKKGRYLKLKNELIVDPEGSLIFENNASLIQINEVNNNSGNITYQRETTPLNRYDYTYWSSPITRSSEDPQTLKKISPTTFYDKYYSYDDGWKASPNGEAVMEAGEGYIIRAPQTHDISGNPEKFSASFEGKPNNGVIKKILNGASVYLLGNPYPSAISADAFLTENDTKLEGTLYFWTHNSPPNEFIGGDKKYNYTASDYAIYNRTGGTGTRATPEPDFNYPEDEINSSIPNGSIAAAQGFFAPASAVVGEIVFNNAMRLTDDEIEYDEFVDDEVRNNSQFFKLGTTSKSTTAIEKNRVWLNLTNEEGAFKQTLIGYISGATNDYEGSFDGVSYDGNQYVDFYSINQELNLSIQGRALPFQQKDSVALGYKTAISGNFKISIDHADGAMTSQKVFLEDKTTQVLHDLKEPYTFTTEKGIFNNRFVLRYEDKNAVIEDISDVAVEGVLISSKNKIITIDTTDEVIKTIHVYDFSGRLVYSDTDVNVTAATISNLSNAAQALIVQVVLENGKKAVKKIIY